MTEHDLEAMAREHAPFLRRLAFALVGEEAAADDLVQETWLAAARARGEDVRSPRAWLAGTTRRLAAGWRRARAARPEAPLGAEPAGPAPEPSAVAEALDAERALLSALGALEEPFRTTVWMRYREGLAPPEIAARLGVPLETVRSRLRRGLARLRERLRADSEGGGSFVLVLAPLIERGSTRRAAAGGAAAAPTLTALITMKKFAPQAALALLVAIPIALRFSGEGTVDPLEEVPEGALSRVAESDEEVAGVPPRTVATEGRRSAVDAGLGTAMELEAPGAWTLTVHAEMRDGSPLFGRPIHVIDTSTETGFAPPRVARSDPDGVAVFEGLARGSFRVEMAGMGRFGPEMVHARELEDRAVTLQLRFQTDVSVVVEDPDGRPIAGARVFAAEEVGSLLPLATTGSSGRATVALHQLAAFFIAAEGYERSLDYMPSELDGSGQGRAEVVVVLESAPRRVAGAVVDAEGEAVAGAMVTASYSRAVVAGYLGQVESLAITDDSGRFEMPHGFSVSTLRLSITAADFAPAMRALVDGSDWEDLRLTVAPGCGLTVLVRSEAGAPAQGAEVRVAVGAWASCETRQISAPVQFKRADTTGCAVFDGLPPGPLTIDASMRLRPNSQVTRRAVRVIERESGSDGRVVLDLGASPRISGRVVDESGAPVEGAYVHAFTETADGDFSCSHQSTGSDGSFDLTGLHGAGPLGSSSGVWGVGVSLGRWRSPDFDAPLATVHGLVPDIDGLEIAVNLDVDRSAWIRGVLRGPGGAPPPADAGVRARQLHGDSGQADSLVDGAFEVGPLAPGEYEVWAVSSIGNSRRSGVRVEAGESVELGEIVLGGGAELRVQPVLAAPDSFHPGAVAALAVTEPITVVSDAGARDELVWFDGGWKSAAPLEPGVWRGAPRPWSRLQVDPFEVDLSDGADRTLRAPVALARLTRVAVVVPPEEGWRTVEIEAREVGAGGAWSTRIAPQARAQVSACPIEIALPIGSACEIRAVTDTGLEGTARVEVAELPERGPAVRIELAPVSER